MNIEQEINESVHLTDYDPQWPIFFNDEKRRLERIFGKNIIAIEHFGSTAIPGLKAKPIIDILIGLPSLSLSDKYIQELTKLGYTGFGEAGVPGRLYFIKRSPLISYNLAITNYNSNIWKDNIILRDYLKTHPEDANQYAQFKENVISSGVGTLLEYSKLKHDFVQTLLGKARIWAKNSSSFN